MTRVSFATLMTLLPILSASTNVYAEAAADAVIQRSREAFDHQDYDEVITILEPLREDGDASSYVRLEAAELVGVAHFLLGEEEAAREVLSALFSEEPDYAFDDTSYSPPILRFVQSVRSSVAGNQVPEHPEDHEDDSSDLPSEPTEEDVTTFQGFSDDEEQVEERRPWYSRWWVWTTVGLVLAAGGITLGVLLADDSEPEPGTMGTCTLPLVPGVRE